MNTRHKSSICARERTWVFSLLAVLAAVFVLYIYFVTASVVQVVIRQELDGEITDTKAKISTLETAYMQAQHQVSAEIASRDGYVAVDHKVYIDQAQDTAVLSLRR